MDKNEKRMMVAGPVCLKGREDLPVEVRRCMAVRSFSGRELGMVAAVCLNPDTQDVATILLGRLPVTADYRLIPVELIDHISEDAVHLSIKAESVEKLAQHAAG